MTMYGIIGKSKYSHRRTIALIEHEIKLIALDIDGTLLNSDGQISPYTEKIIATALQNDINIVLSTGRPLPFCSHIATQLNTTHYIITNNGAEIWKNKQEVIARHFMNPQTVEQLWTYGHGKDLLTWMVTPTELFRHSRRPEQFSDFEWLKFGYGHLNRQIRDRLYDKLAIHEDLEITSSASNNIEINQKGVNKVNALKRICEELDISLSNVMAIGDNSNDLQMIKNVGFGVAVDNATINLKEHAKFITASNDEDGVAKAIKKFVL